MTYIKQAADRRRWNGKPSVTQLLHGTREAWLDLTVPEITIDPADSAFRIIGSRGHYRLEGIKTPESFAPERLELWVVTGLFDELEYDGQRLRLIDTKISGSYKIAQAIGVERVAHPIPVLDESGEPVRLKSGKNKGEIKTVNQYELVVHPERADLGDWSLQLNAYRMMVESALEVKVDDQFIFAIPRDGGTIAAKQRGVMEKMYMIPVPILPDNMVEEYFTAKRDALQAALEGLVPSECDESESWEGRKCKGYCSVSEECKRMGCRWQNV